MALTSPHFSTVEYVWRSVFSPLVVLGIAIRVIWTNKPRPLEDFIFIIFALIAIAVRYLRSRSEERQQAEEARRVKEYRRQRREEGLDEEEGPVTPSPQPRTGEDDPARRIWEELFGPQESPVPQPESKPLPSRPGAEYEGRSPYGQQDHRYMPSEDLQKMPPQAPASSGTSEIPPGVNIAEWAENERREARKRIEAELAASEAESRRGTPQSKKLTVNLRQAVIHDIILNAPYLGKHGHYSKPSGE